MTNSAWNWIGDGLLAVMAMAVTPLIMGAVLMVVGGELTKCGDPPLWWMWATPLAGMIIGPLIVLRMLRGQLRDESKLDDLRRI